MKLTLTALGGVLALGMLAGPFSVQPALAQDSTMFRDVPENHWAYQDVKRLKDDGLLKGYPGEVFIGQRPMTRYEFAAATRAVYENLLNRINNLPGGGGNNADLQKQINDLQAKVDANTGDITALKSDIATLKQQMDALNGLRDDVDRLKRLADTFEKELANLGVDVQNLTSRMDKAEANIAELLKRPIPINIQGRLFGGARLAYGTSNKNGIDLNGTVFGVRPSSISNAQISAGVDKDNHVVHQLDLDVNGNFGNGVRGSATLVVGNYLSYLGGSATNFPVGAFRNEGSTDVSIYRAGVTFNIGALNGIEVQAGRLGYQVSPYTYMRIDPDYYFDVPLYDDGNIYADGVRLGFGWTKIKLDVIATKDNNVSGTDFSNYQQIFAGNLRNLNVNFFDPGNIFGSNALQMRPAGIVQGDLAVRTTLGAHLRAVLSQEANLGLTYLVLDGDAVPTIAATANQFNRTAVFGGDFDIKFGGALRAKAEYSQSQLYYNGSNRLNKDNWAADAEIRYESGDTFHVGVGYKEIRPYFAAPGAWGRIGFWYNPTDIRGVYVGAHYKLSNAFGLAASGEFYQGTGRARDAATGTVTGFDTHDKINRVLVNANYDINSVWKVSADWEGVFWDLKDRGTPLNFTGGKPQENYYTVGLGYQLGTDALLKFMYQIVDYDSKGVTGWVAPGSTDPRARGGLFVTQLSVKF